MIHDCLVLIEIQETQIWILAIVSVHTELVIGIKIEAC